MPSGEGERNAMNLSDDGWIGHQKAVINPYSGVFLGENNNVGCEGFVCRAARVCCVDALA